MPGDHADGCFRSPRRNGSTKGGDIPDVFMTSYGVQIKNIQFANVHQSSLTAGGMLWCLTRNKY